MSEKYFATGNNALRGGHFNLNYPSLPLLGDVQRCFQPQVGGEREKEDMCGVVSGSASASIGRNLISFQAFYYTKWFWVVYVVAALGGLFLIYLLRVRQVTRQLRAQLEARLDEHDRIARDLNHTLLQNIQGLILQIDAMMKQFSPEEPARQALEKMLDRADEVLAESINQFRRLLGTESLSDLPVDSRESARKPRRTGRQTSK